MKYLSNSTFSCALPLSRTVPKSKLGLEYSSKVSFATLVETLTFPLILPATSKLVVSLSVNKFKAYSSSFGTNSLSLPNTWVNSASNLNPSNCFPALTNDSNLLFVSLSKLYIVPTNKLEVSVSFLTTADNNNLSFSVNLNPLSL